MHKAIYFIKEIAFLFQSFKKPIMTNKTWFLNGVIIMFCAGLSQISIPYFLGKLIDVLSGREIEISVQSTFCALLAAFFLNSLFNLAKNYCFIMFAEKTTIEIVQMLFSRIIRYPLSFFDNAQVGCTSSRLNNDIQSLKRIFSEQFAMLFYHSLIIIVCMYEMIVINLKLTLLLLLIFPFILWTAILLGEKIKIVSKENYDLYAKANQVLSEDFLLIRVIKCFCGEEYEDNKFHKIMSEIRGKTVSNSFNGSSLQFQISVLLIAGLSMVMLYAINLIQRSEITTGVFFEFVIYTIFIINAISSISSVFISVMNTVSTTKTFRILLDLKEENFLGYHVSNDFKKIQLNNVYFAYESRPNNVLNDISITLNVGEHIGIIGESGCGKSTLVQLLLGFYKPISGQILFDGIDINKLSLKEYRKLFGVVSQNIELFAGSIKDNIKYPNINISDDDVIKAAHYACAHDFIISFPNGYNTMIGENGITLSGGQRQRIAIARALVRKPKIIILDEATSALDIETEQCINDFLSKITNDITLVVLTHHISVIQKMDKAYEIKNRIIKKVNII